MHKQRTIHPRGDEYLLRLKFSAISAIFVTVVTCSSSIAPACFCYMSFLLIWQRRCCHKWPYLQLHQFDLLQNEMIDFSQSSKEWFYILIKILHLTGSFKVVLFFCSVRSATVYKAAISVSFTPLKKTIVLNLHCPVSLPRSMCVSVCERETNWAGIGCRYGGGQSGKFHKNVIIF